MTCGILTRFFSLFYTRSITTIRHYVSKFASLRSTLRLTSLQFLTPNNTNSGQWKLTGLVKKTEIHLEKLRLAKIARKLACFHLTDWGCSVELMLQPGEWPPLYSGRAFGYHSHTYCRAADCSIARNREKSESSAGSSYVSPNIHVVIRVPHADWLPVGGTVEDVIARHPIRSVVS